MAKKDLERLYAEQAAEEAALEQPEPVAQEDEITPVEQQPPLPTARLVTPQTFTPASEFRQRSELVPIDGGKVWVEVRRMDLKSLVASGRIPNPLLSAAIRVVESEDKEPPEREEDETEEAFHKATTDYYEVVNIMVIAIVKNPTLVMTMEEEDANPETVWVGRIIQSDRTVLLSAAQAEVGALNLFRERYSRAHVGQSGSEVWAEAE